MKQRTNITEYVKEKLILFLLLKKKLDISDDIHLRHLFFRIILMFIYTSCLHVIITFYRQRQKFFFLHVLYFNARLFRASFLRVQQLLISNSQTLWLFSDIYIRMYILPDTHIQACTFMLSRSIIFTRSVHRDFYISGSSHFILLVFGT